jgi:hypothetical protein
MQDGEENATEGDLSLLPFPYNKTEADRDNTGWLHWILFT